MAFESFKPVTWAAGILVRLRKALVFGSIANREYQGQLQAGASIKINEIGPVTVNTYAGNTDITWEQLPDASKTLLIDQQKYFAFDVDDVDSVQSNVNLLAAAQGEAAYAIADTVDQFIAGLYGDAGNTVSALTVTAGAVIQNLSNFALKLDEANVPQAGRFIVVPPWYHQHLVNAVTGAISATGVPKQMPNGVLMNGYVGELYGFNVMMSNNVNNNGTTWNIVAGNMSAIAYVGQISKIEAVRREDRFSDGIKGLYIYGAKVVRPNALVSCAATKG